IAVILSALATDVGVNKATKVLFKVANTPEQIYSLGEQKLAEYIKSIGLYKTKAQNVIATCKELIEKFGSIVPDNFDDLISLAG
ncbi:endonuclease III, partial [Francisella tularensis subsp. holarctica]|uniref:endonuclease III domain-containing protein n=1 Tax=Francisella tularensis TaxID=263 RepID=UPI0023AE4C02|nr:endonuclease III [Francisella tularensis subsp. holarctica]